MRTPEQIDAAKATAQQTANDISSESYPPGYIQGFKHILGNDLKVTIKPGVASVAGTSVNITVDIVLTTANWTATQIGPHWFYVYLTRDGVYQVDAMQPVYNSDYAADYHPIMNTWRNIGRLYVTSDNNISFAIDWSQVADQSVTIAPGFYKGFATYYCTGTNDQIIINAAIAYLETCYYGGSILLLAGTYNISASIIPSYSINITGEGYSTKIVPTNDEYAFYALGTSISRIFGIKISNLFIDGNDVSSFDAIRFEYVDSLVIDNIRIDDSNIGIEIIYSNSVIIRNCCLYNLIFHISIYYTDALISGNTLDNNSIVKSANIAIQVAFGTSRKTIISNNFIQNLKATGNIWGITVTDDSNIINNVIKNLESTGDSNCKAIDLAGSTLFDGGIVSDNNISSCITASSTITKKAAISINSNRSVLTSNRVSSCSMGIYIKQSNNLITSNYCYNNGLDTGIANTNQNNFYDAGTDTISYSNSWQQSVSGETSLGELHQMAPYEALPSVQSTQAAIINKLFITSTMGIPVGSKAVQVIYAVRQVSTYGKYGILYKTTAYGNRTLFQYTQNVNISAAIAGPVYLSNYLTTAPYMGWQAETTDVLNYLQLVGYYI